MQSSISDEFQSDYRLVKTLLFDQIGILTWTVQYNINTLLSKKWSVDFRLIFYEWSILFYYTNNVRPINLRPSHSQLEIKESDLVT